ncbi:MAG: hypothetical protein C4333_02185 [Meiothermus sp.]
MLCTVDAPFHKPLQCFGRLHEPYFTKGGKVAGLGLIKDLAEREQALARQLEEAKQAAQAKIKEAEAQAAQIVAQAQDAVRELEGRMRAQTAEAVARLEAEAKARAEAEAQSIVQAAEARIEGAVKLVLGEVLP